MRNVSWLRYTMAVLLAAAASASALVACSDDPAPAKPTTDSGTADTGTADTGTTDAQADAKDAARPEYAKLIIVNAAHSFGPKGDVAPGVNAIRICFARGKTDKLDDGFAPYSPLPVPKDTKIVGIPNGTGGSFPDFGVDLEPLFVQPYLMNAASLAKKGILGGDGSDCPGLLSAANPKGLKENEDYWKLPTIAGGTFKQKKTFVLALTGCTGDVEKKDPDTFRSKCGDGMPAEQAAGPGNLKITVQELDRDTTVAADSIGAQVFHASTAWPVTAGKRLTVAPALVTPGTPEKVDPITPSGSPVELLKGTNALVQVKGPLPPSISVNPENKDGDGKIVSLPLALVQGLSGQKDPYALGKGYVFVAVGDPEVKLMPDPSKPTELQPHGFHFLGFPVNPTLPPLNP